MASAGRRADAADIAVAAAVSVVVAFVCRNAL
jgi:hypothetical protein